MDAGAGGALNGSAAISLIDGVSWSNNIIGMVPCALTRYVKCEIIPGKPRTLNRPLVNHGSCCLGTKGAEIPSKKAKLDNQ